MILQHIEKSTFVQDFQWVFLIGDLLKFLPTILIEICTIFYKENPLEILDKSRFFDVP